MPRADGRKKFHTWPINTTGEKLKKDLRSGDFPDVVPLFACAAGKIAKMP
jgi:hypothetical protein